MTATGCSITSAATVSTTGATGCFTFGAAFFTGAGLGLAVRLDAFADLATLRALPRAVAAFLFCAFDCFLRLAMIRPVPVGGLQYIDARSLSPGNPSYELSTACGLSAPAWALILLGRSEASLFCSPSEGRPSMGDYHSIIARAVSHLPSTADEARHAIYEQARTALHERLSNDPQISDTELVNEHYRLEVAIYEVEDDLLLSAMRRFVTEETAFSPPSLIISKIKEFVCSSGAKFVRLGVF